MNHHRGLEMKAVSSPGARRRGTHGRGESGSEELIWISE